jgi:hypothetical protein
MAGKYQESWGEKMRRFFETGDPSIGILVPVTTVRGNELDLVLPGEGQK